jgi:hypothetical protein
MAHGLPDFGPTASKAQLYAGVDMAELAARLGALPRYDRLGDVIFYEDFCSDLGAWEIETSGLGSEVVVTAERFVSGGFSCRLTAGSNLLRYAGISLRAPVPYSVMYGVEVQSTMHLDMDYIYTLIDVYTGQWHLAFGVRYDKATNLNSYYNAAGGWTAIPGAILPYYDSHNFIVSKYTFNIAAGRYSRLLIPPRLIDLSGYIGYAVPDVLNRPRLEWSGRIYADLGTNPVTYIDSLILTANDI